MKAIFSKAIMASLVLLTVSCNKGNDSTPPTPPPIVVPASFTATYSYTINKEIFDAMDITLYFIDENGDQKSELLSDSTITKTVKAAVIPCLSGSKLSFKLKDDAPEKLYNVNIKKAYSYSLKAEDEAQDQTGSNSDKTTYSGIEKADLLAFFNETKIGFGFSVTKNNVTEQEITWK